MKSARALTALLVLAAAPLRAAETASFLDAGVGARGLALGGAYTALADDANALFWNPADLASLKQREVSVSDAGLAQSARLDAAAFAAPASFGTLAAGGEYLSQSSLDGRDALGRPTGGFAASDAALAGAFARHTELADLGAAVKFVQSHIGSAQASAAAVDLGARRTIGAATVGAALRNAGPGMKFGSETDDLPLRLALGAAYALPGGHLVALEVTDGPRGAGTDVGMGGEYQALKGVYLRGGYTTKSAVAGGSSFDAARGLTLGLGLQLQGVRLDYAAVPMGELGTAHRFTLAWRW